MKPNLLIIFFLLNFYISKSQSIINTVHNMSVSGFGDIKSSNESEICIFCHTTHQSDPKTPMWNRNTKGVSYILYNSSTLTATAGQPDGSSILCLSCHDGTIAPGNIKSRKSEIDFGMSKRSFKSSKSNLTTDLSDDHIISIMYNSSLAFSDGQIKEPSSLNSGVKLENEKIQCTSCHNPHKNTYEKFLVASTKYSELCLNCHNRNYWETSIHNTSQAKWNNKGTSPWKDSKYITVSENACENCHTAHNASSEEYLLLSKTEESNCFSCHNGNVDSKNIQQQINKPYSHNVYGYYLNHKPNENLPVTDKHVECQDCHNPHSSKTNKADAPYLNGANFGTTGIDINGNEVKTAVYEYEICFKCHADSPNKSNNNISRQIDQTNVRLEFNTSNPSYHPIASSGKNPTISGLIYPMNESSIIYCTSCHASNGENSPAGPHGSIYPNIMKYNYSTTDNTPESYNSYELCYKCHDRNTIIYGETNNFQKLVHKKHIVDLKTPCSVCHDPHGISYLQGNSTNNSGLINFDINVVSPSNGNLKYEKTGNYRGSCYLTCHGKTHNPKSYN